MRRREFITLLGGVIAAWPLSARAQQTAKPARLGYIWIGSKGSEHSTLDGLRQGLSDLGYTEGRDFVIDDRYADSRPERLPGIVADLIRTKVDLILSPGNPVTQAAKRATSTIPIISTTPDLLASGFVANLAHPGGNITVMSLTAGAALAEKWVELLHESFPGVKNVAVLSSPISLASSAYLERIRGAASALGMQLQNFSARNPVELQQAGLNLVTLCVSSFGQLHSRYCWRACHWHQLRQPSRSRRFAERRLHQLWVAIRRPCR